MHHLRPLTIWSLAAGFVLLCAGTVSEAQGQKLAPADEDGDYFIPRTRSTMTSPAKKSEGTVNRDATQPSPPIRTFPAGTIQPRKPVTSPKRTLTKEERLRRYQARQIFKEHGVTVDWQKHSITEMFDMRSRLQQTKKIMSLGEKVDWRTHSVSELAELKNRIRAGEELKDLGKPVDWRDHSELEMLNMQIRIYVNNRVY